MCAEAPVDIAVIEYWHMAPLFAAITARRRVLLAHDAEASVWATRIACAEPAARVAMQREGAARIAREAAACRAADVVLALTEADRRALGADGVLPFAPQIALAPAAPPRHEGPPTVVFFGSFHAAFNRDAARWLVEEIVPPIIAAVPGVRVMLAGSGDPGAAVRAAAARLPQVTLAGYVDDPARLLREATVVVLPLRYGGGLHVRLFDAFAQGAAVVTTTLGVAGVPFRDGHEVRVADDAPAFAAAVVDLARDAATRHRLGEAARLRLLADYGAEQVAERTRALFAALAAGQPMPAWARGDGPHGGGESPAA